ncbi:MAG: hypothetical protein ACM65L_08755 [Microcoleus sp.]
MPRNRVCATDLVTTPKFSKKTDIPAIRNAPEFKRLIPQLKNRPQKQHIALILLFDS